MEWPSDDYAGIQDKRNSQRNNAKISDRITQWPNFCKEQDVRETEETILIIRGKWWETPRKQ